MYGPSPSLAYQEYKAAMKQLVDSLRLQNERNARAASALRLQAVQSESVQGLTIQVVAVALAVGVAGLATAATVKARNAA